MCTFIGVECLAANALIELYDHGIQQISFNKLADYGLMVVEAYEEEMCDNAVFIFDQNKLHGLVIDYSDYFMVEVLNGEKSIGLKENVDILELKRRFRWTLSYSILKAVSKVKIEEVFMA